MRSMAMRAKTDLIKKYWNPKEKLGQLKHFQRQLALIIRKCIAMYGIFFSNRALPISKNIRGCLQISIWIPIALTQYMLFLRSHKPRKNTFLLLSIVLNKAEFFRPSRDVQIVCEVRKGGSVLRRKFCFIFTTSKPCKN